MVLTSEKHHFLMVLASEKHHFLMVLMIEKHHFLMVLASEKHHFLWFWRVKSIIFDVFDELKLSFLMFLMS
jgi:hypothetical protein